MFKQRFGDYTLKAFQRDLTAGLIVGLVAWPLAMAFAIASGVEPEAGLYTAIIAGILISLLGGSRFQIGGPTGAFVPLLLGIVTLYGYEKLLVAGFLAGCFLVLMGVLKLGSLIDYVPRPVVIGFTAGIAVIIFTGQIANFLGLTGVKSHPEFLDNMAELIRNLSSVNAYAVITALVCLSTLLMTNRWLPKIPGPLVGLVLSTLAAYLLFPGKVTTIGSAYGKLTASLPMPKLPDLSLDTIQLMLVPALMIAALGGIESLLSATVADNMTGDRHHSNRELIGQGIANMAAPLFGGIPATGAIARTATNIRSGAASRLSGVIHGVVVLLIMVLMAPLASHIPLASLAPILMVVAWNMSERKRFIYMLRWKSAESLVLVVTFLATVLVDLTTGVGVGMALAFVHFINKMSRLDISIHPASDFRRNSIVVCMMKGVLFFGAARRMERQMIASLADKPKFVMLNMTKVLYMDTTGVAYLSEVVLHVLRYGGSVYIIGAQAQPLESMIKSGLGNREGVHFCYDLTDALRKATATGHVHGQQSAEEKIQRQSKTAAL
jgi:SulP family sulfate permease